MARIPVTSAELRETNLARALRVVHLADDELTRARLSRELRVTRATALALASDLDALGLVVETAATRTGRRGRPTTRLVPAPGGPVVVALELAIDRVRSAAVTLGGGAEATASTPIGRRDPGHVVELARAELERRLKAVGRRAAGVGVAVHGMVDHRSGGVALAPNLGWEDVDLLGALGLPPELPVRIDNVAHLAALAEARRGRGRGLHTVLFIHCAVGLGGALVLDGQPAHGRSGFAGEYGHLPFGRDGVPCRCGARGCWETEVDQTALARAAGRPASPATAARVAAGVLADAARGDAVALTAVERAGAALGRGLGALVKTHDPELVVLSDHAADLHGAARAPVEREMREATMRAHRGRLPSLEASALGAEGALIGAAEAIFDDAIAHPTSLSRAAA